MKLKYDKVIQDLKNSSDKLDIDIYQQWILCNGSYNIKEEFFYENLTKYKPIYYKCPKFLNKKSDCKILLRLICSSPDFEYAFVIFKPTENEFDDKIPELIMAMENNGKSVAKKLSELNKLQIKTMFSILIKAEISRYYYFVKVGDKKALKIYTEYMDYLLAKYQHETEEIKNIQKTINTNKKNIKN
ncbi:MAG: hypothetical protein PHW83_01500 [Bacteroidales bacterium]|nr:hypothetical protein [Bacteroidales bacterium]